MAGNTNTARKNTAKKAVRDEVRDEAVNIAEGLVFIGEVKFQLKISVGVGLAIPEDATKVEVCNLGAGDLYVDTDKFEYNRDNVILPGSSKLFDGAAELRFISTCKPTVVVKFFK